MRRQITTEMLRHDFTPQEMQEKSLLFAQAFERLTAAEEQKKHAVSQFAERITQEKAALGSFSRAINAGWEMRNIELRISYNDPNTGFKTYYRQDNNALVKSLAMTPDEMQETLFVEPEPDDPSKALEENIRQFFGLKAGTIDDGEPFDVAGYTTADGWLVVAASPEFAQKYIEDKGYEVAALPEYADPDTTIISGDVAKVFGSPTVTLCQAIDYATSEGFHFPLLLAAPEQFMEALKAGKDPDKEVAEEKPAEAPAKKKRGNAAKIVEMDAPEPSDDENEPF